MEINLQNKREMLIFDYVPNLKVVGTFHSLSQEEKNTLEKLIDESDFVALEYDNRRDKGKIAITSNRVRWGYSAEDNTYYIGFWNGVYLSLFMGLNELHIKLANKILKPQHGEVDESSTEFHCPRQGYSYRL